MFSSQTGNSFWDKVDDERGIVAAFLGMVGLAKDVAMEVSADYILG